MQDEQIGKMALVGDVWYQIMDRRFINGEYKYKLYSRDSWVPLSWIKEIKDKEVKKVVSELELVAENGSKYRYVDTGNHVVLYSNDKEWGVLPQGDRFLKALLNEVHRLNKLISEK